MSLFFYIKDNNNNNNNNSAFIIYSKYIRHDHNFISEAIFCSIFI